MLKQSEVKERLMELVKEGNEEAKVAGFEITAKQADFLIKAIDGIREEDLIATGKTKLPGVGTLEIRYRKSRLGKNPKTSEEITIPEQLTVALSASDTIKKKVAEQVDIATYRK